MLRENLKIFREKFGYSRPQLARKAEINIRVIERIEWGITKNPSLRTLEKLAKALDVTVNDLIK